MNIHSEQDQPYLSRLTDFIKKGYAITAISMIPAKRGYYGETWRMETENGNFFLKLDYSLNHQGKYRNSLEVMEYLCENGIDFIPRIVKTLTGNLFSVFDSAVLVIFEWVEAENIETDETKIPEYDMLGRIYPLTKPGFKIPSLEFSDQKAVSFFAKWEKLKEEPKSGENEAILSVFERHRELLERYSSRLSLFSNVCLKDKPPFFLTHGDAGGNFLIGKDGKYYLVDWDEVMYAPLERDAWVMCCRDWAVKAFHETLRRNHISYTLRPEILAFYCYHMFFLYLGEFLDDFTLYGKRKEIEEYFDGWIMERMKYADSLESK